MVSYDAGPDHSTAVEAALLHAWVVLAIPAWAWRLYPRSAAAEFVDASHEHDYFEARLELCRALFFLRSQAWAQYDMKIASFFGPADGVHEPPNAYEASEENQELLGSVVD